MKRLPSAPPRRPAAAGIPLNRRGRLAWGVTGVVIVLAVMQLGVASGVISADSVPTATAMLRRAVGLVTTQSFLSAVGDTLLATLAAFGLATAAGLLLGVAIGATEPLYRALNGLIDFMRPIPSVALLPIAVLIFGLGAEMKIVLATYAAFWPVLINTIYGVRDVDRVMVSTARSFAWGRTRVMRQVMLPASLPFVATGLRLATAVALVVVLTAELLAAEGGVGTVIRAYQAAGRVDYVYAGILIVALIGLLLSMLVGAGERRLLRWSPQHRS